MSAINTLGQPPPPLDAFKMYVPYKGKGKNCHISTFLRDSNKKNDETRNDFYSGDVPPKKSEQKSVPSDLLNVYDFSVKMLNTSQLFTALLARKAEL